MMKTIKFNICKYKITITIERKKYKTTDEVVEVSEPVGTSEDWVFQTEPSMSVLSEEFKMEEPKNDFSQAELVYDWFHRYVLDLANSGNYSVSTIRGYQNIYMRHLHIMMLAPTDSLSEGLIQKAFDEEINKGMSEKTMKGYRSLVNRVLKKYAPDLHPEIRIKKEAADENT